MRLAVEPDPPLASLFEASDPPIAGKGSAKIRPFDGAVFDALIFDVGVYFAGDWRQLLDPPTRPVTVEADPRIMDCNPGGFDHRDFEAVDFDVRYGSFCPTPDPPLVEVLVEADPA